MTNDTFNQLHIKNEIKSKFDEKKVKCCSKCFQELPFSRFGNHSQGKYKLRAECKECKKKYYTEYRQRTIATQQVRKNRLLTVYKISIEEYNELFDKQKGVCAICCKPEKIVSNDKIINLSVDHDHSCCLGKKSCGKCIRGLLCHSCNTGIGRFYDDINLLNSAIVYLQNNKSLENKNS